MDVHEFADYVYVIKEPIEGIKGPTGYIGNEGEGVSTCLSNDLYSFQFKQRFKNPEQWSGISQLFYES